MDGGLCRRRDLIRKVSRILFGACVSVMFVSALGVWVAMHRNLYGPGGELIPHLEAAWKWVAALFGQPDARYLPKIWADGFVLRPSAIGLWFGYLALLAVLKFSPWGRRFSFSSLAGAAVIVGLPLVLAPYLMSSDLFDYSSYGRLPLIHHSNPYTSTISEFPDDPLYPVTCWKTAPSVYGPAWTIFSMGLVAISELVGGDIAAYAVVFRLAMLLFQIVIGALLWKILERADAGNVPLKTAIFLFNPAVFLEFPGNGHNEAMMLAFLLAGILFAQRDRWAVATVFFAVAAQTKLYCLPVFCLYAAHRCWKADSPREAARRFLSLSLLFAGVSALLYLPFGLNATTILAPIHGPGGDTMTKSLGDYLANKSSVELSNIPVLGLLFRGHESQDVQRMALLLTLLVCVISAFYAKTLSQAVTASAFFALFWCAVGATWFMTWYVTFVIALIPLSRSRAVSLAGGTLSFTVFTIYLLEGWNFSPNGSVHNFGVAHYEVITFLPPLIVLVGAQAVASYVARRRIDTLPPVADQHLRA